LPTAGVIQEEPGIGLAPILKDLDERALGEIGSDMVFRKKGKSHSVETGIS
jgi:hypothetical protein